MNGNLRRRNDPLGNLTSLHSQLDDMFGSLLAPMPRMQSLPDIDIYTEDNKALIAEVHAAGFGEDDIEVNINDGVLEIRGEKQEKVEDKGKKRNYMVRESHASFYRSIALPKQADADKIEATFENGVLKVTVPFRDMPEPKRIPISWNSNNKSKK